MSLLILRSVSPVPVSLLRPTDCTRVLLLGTVYFVSTSLRYFIPLPPERT